MDRKKLNEIKALKDEQKKKTKGKDKLSAKEKDELLITMAKMLGLI